MESVRAGRFRADLLARLDGLTVRLPPLRERREDVLPLFSRLLADVGHGRAPAFDSEFAERLCLHDWPFNVRELVLLVRRLLTLHGSEIDADARSTCRRASARRRHRARGRARGDARRAGAAAPATPRRAASPSSFRR